VKTTFCFKGFFAVSLSLILIAGILDDPVILSAGTAVGFFLFIRSIIFLSGISHIVQTIRCTRTLEKSFIRQGRSNGVQTVLSLQIPQGFCVIYEDLIPSFCQKNAGEAVSGRLTKGYHEISLSYRFIPSYHGTIAHPGGRIHVQDLFFQSSLPVRQQGTPLSVQVQPWPLFDPSQKSKTTHELERIGPAGGYSVREFREYLPGDDLRYVDWKISAKRGSLYIREYATPADEQPMIIVDLPDTGQITDMVAFSRMVSSLSGYIESVIGKKEPVSLLLISGPNMGDVLYEGRDMAHCLTIIRESVHSAPRTFHLYRFLMRSEMRVHIHRMESRLKQGKLKEQDRNFLSRVRDLRTSHLSHIKSTRFQAALSTILFSGKIHEIILYSLCDGDISHIREIASLAHQQNTQFTIRTPKRTDFFLAPKMLRGELVEVI